MAKTSPFEFCKEKSGKVKVTFGNFDQAKKCYVKIKLTERDDAYDVSLYKDSGYNKAFQQEIFKGSDVCGLDWGSFEEQQKVMKCCYKPPKIYTYVTIINKTKSISLLFSRDEGEQLNEWKNALKQLLYGGHTYIREKLNYEGKDVMLQVGKVNISLTEDKRDLEPARPKHSWPKDMLYECPINGRIMTMTIKSPHHQNITNIQLECQRGACQNGAVMTPEETILQIRKTLFEFVVCYWFTKEKVYESLQNSIYTDYGSDYYDLNKLEGLGPYGDPDQIRNNMENIYKKCRDNEGQYTSPNDPNTLPFLSQVEKTVMNAAHVIKLIRENPPPDTLHLPVEIRTDICYKLYANTELDRTGDWTALASEIGKCELKVSVS